MGHAGCVLVVWVHQVWKIVVTGIVVGVGVAVKVIGTRNVLMGWRMAVR